MRFRLDGTWKRLGEDRSNVLAGSPLRIFRLTAAGARVADRIEAGDDVDGSVLTDRFLDAGAVHPIIDEVGSTYSLSDVTIVTPQLGGVVADDERVTVDDGSSPPLVGATARLSVNRGPSAARNIGRRHVDTDLIAFVDADVDLPFGLDGSDEGRAWWGRLLGHFEDDRVGLVAPRVTGDERSSLDLGSEPARISAGTRVSYVPAAMIVVRATAFDDVGGFDETLRFGEDVDVVWRLDQAGWRCRYEPASTVVHRQRDTLAAKLRQQVGYGSSSAPLAMRHPRLLAPLAATRWTATSWLLGAWGRPFTAAGIAGVGAVRATQRIPEMPWAAMAELFARSQRDGALQLARTIRRAWWPAVFLAALVSRRARRIAALAIIASLRETPFDIAFGWGLWKSVLHHRTTLPLRPRVIQWP